MSTDKTLADVQPGGRVRLGDQARATISDDLLSRMAYAIPGAVKTTDVAKQVAARVVEIYLSALPSPGKQAAHCPVKHCGMTYARVPADGRCHACGATVQPSPGGQECAGLLPDDARIIGVIADSIERGKLDHPGFYRNTQLGEVLRRVLSAALASRQPVGEPVAWISRIRCVGPEYGKEIYGKLPVQSLNPLYYEHIPLYAAPPVGAK
ncbi:hypothetical protein ACNPMX_11780 [Stenotrophomonas maltophilia]